ncbi:TPA: hypothetical protein U9I93_001739 [Acinetobacter baumannii]|uniref:hypothetical protein n=1 Tax=Acinetobacter baumannii TaxID=470 RepID=UPI0024DED19F|nr:hypothetical protein [Acinetobacter baumannii]MDK2201354.1 hypothetical protein [Acinetobacter baumannii]HAV5431045.1 hypothetical protein [Acinetobacter baumannii]HEN9535428.1 hypothetical protein [Acinetobacter baumannii]
MSHDILVLSEVQVHKRQIFAAKKAAEIVTLREWYDSTVHGYELEEYFKFFSNLGRLGKELHKRNVKRVTELYEADRGIFVEATFVRRDLDLVAPLCALACIFEKLKKA